MVVYETSKFIIYFGDDSRSVSLSSNELKTNIEASLKKFKDVIKTKSLIFAKQIHGTNGIIVSDEYKLQSPLDVPGETGDIILTNRKEIGIGVLTADCLPIVFYDRKNHSLAVAHAGWRGSMAGITKRTISMMEDRFESNPNDIEVHFGPAAKACCYEVQDDFVSNLGSEKDYRKFIAARGNKLFFDNSALNKHHLLDIGVKEDQIKADHHECTICHTKYCSYRRDNEYANRQVTIAVLKD